MSDRLSIHKGRVSSSKDVDNDDHPLTLTASGFSSRLWVLHPSDCFFSWNAHLPVIRINPVNLLI